MKKQYQIFVQNFPDILVRERYEPTDYPEKTSIIEQASLGETKNSFDTENQAEIALEKYLNEVDMEYFDKTSTFIILPTYKKL